MSIISISIHPQPVYGHSNKNGYLPFRHASGGGRELFFTDEKEVDLQSLLTEQSVKIPLEPTIKGMYVYLCNDPV